MAFYTLTVIFHELKSICMKCDVNHLRINMYDKSIKFVFEP